MPLIFEIELVKQVEINVATQQMKSFSVTVLHISLKLIKRSMFGAMETPILADVSAHFNVGNVSVILGGSGAGKVACSFKLKY